ncbi:MAG: bifunctional glycosyltransferase family 2/GtrA family protein [Oscillospiraceae bacterium]|nr:bifunctional glycosyltransferase family 2/GtrA family protein [Oscillospiraceae bacterium]
MANYRTDVTIVLPSLNPDETFLRVVTELVEAGFADILIVNDGSDPDRVVWFERAAALPGCTVLTHEVNRGKGRALKTAFAYLTAHRPHSRGAVTIDGDGQHRTKDIIACAQAMLEHPDQVILGCRDFHSPNVPPKSRSGNQFTSALFRIGCGIRLSDTQTGLRAIPRQYLPGFCEIKGERFEYETNMLLTMKRQGIGFLEVPIETVYEGKNEGTHFRPIVDSLKIMKLIFAFMASSLSATAVDLAMFYVLLTVLPQSAWRILLATILARAVSSFWNFNLNRKVVFGSQGSYGRAFGKYYALAIPQMLVSAGLVSLLDHFLAPGSKLIATLLKVLVDTLLFFISFTIQREWVFKK